MQNQVSFKANFINQATILQRNALKHYSPKTVTFAQLNPDLPGDMNAVSTLDALWENSKSLANAIKQEMLDSTEFFNNAGKKFYALTTQEQGLENLNHKEILGLAEVIPGNNNVKLKFLQVNPQYIRGQKRAEFKHIGTAILDSIKALFPSHSIALQTVKNAKKFYIANGFRNNTADPTNMVFRH